MNKKQIAITLGIVCLILTMFVVIQIRTTNNANKVVSQTFTSNDLRNQVLKWKERYDTTYAELQSSEKKLEDVRQQASENTDGSDEKEAELKKNNILIGLTDVTGEGVIVGRCADYALADYKNSVHVFIHSDMDSKVKRIMEKYKVNESKARDMITKKDKQRQSYYNYYSSKKWGRSDTYDLSVNSGKLGIDGTVNLIMQYVDDFEKKL